MANDRCAAQPAQCALDEAVPRDRQAIRQQRSGRASGGALGLQAIGMCQRWWEPGFRKTGV